ncbi:MAG: amino acid ABC transporter permease [Thermomicrobiales bacterium]|nr:amino acid ABC transporter permease [Thermomicrobiales bacterium]
MNPDPVEAPRKLSEAEIEALLVRPSVWKRRDVQRSLLIATLSTVVLGALIAYVLSESTGWDAVRRSFLSWHHFQEAMPRVWDGFKLNIKIFLIAEPIVLVVGLLLALARLSRNPVLFPIRAFAVFFIDVFRGAPALLVILMLGFGVPGLRIEGLPREPVFWGTVAIILTSSAYTAETFRAGIESIHPGQRAAARSLGLSNVRAQLHVVLPQAIRNVIPPLLSGFVALQKETSLVSAIGPLEATRQAQIYAGTTFNFTSYLAAALLFAAVTVPLARLTDHLLVRSGKSRASGGAV